MLLAAFAQAASKTQRLAKKDDAASVKSWDQSCRAMMALARSLRATPQATTHHETAGRRRANGAIATPPGKRKSHTAAVKSTTVTTMLNPAKQREAEGVFDSLLRLCDHHGKDRFFEIGDRLRLKITPNFTSECTTITVFSVSNRDDDRRVGYRPSRLSAELHRLSPRLLEIHRHSRRRPTKPGTQNTWEN